MMKDNTNSGFSLIELIIAMTILLVLSGMIFLGSDSARRKETEKYAAALGNEILMARTASMSKAGKWRLGLYLKEKEYYCILESEEKASGESGGVYWESRSEKVRLGHAGAVDYEWVSGSGDPDGEGNVSDGAETGEGSLEKGKLIHAWRFDRDTGSCMEGAGTLKVTGVGRTRTITVYKENGRVDISNVK